MIKSKLIHTIWGKCRVIDNWKDSERLYVHKTNLKTYVVSTKSRLTLDTMVEVCGEYHFNTLKELHGALNG